MKIWLVHKHVDFIPASLHPRPPPLTVHRHYSPSAASSAHCSLPPPPSITAASSAHHLLPPHLPHYTASASEQPLRSLSTASGHCPLPPLPPPLTTAASFAQHPLPGRYHCRLLQSLPTASDHWPPTVHYPLPPPPFPLISASSEHRHLLQTLPPPPITVHCNHRFIATTPPPPLTACCLRSLSAAITATSDHLCCLLHPPPAAYVHPLPLPPLITSAASSANRPLPTLTTHCHRRFFQLSQLPPLLTTCCLRSPPAATTPPPPPYLDRLAGAQFRNPDVSKFIYIFIQILIRNKTNRTCLLKSAIAVRKKSSYIKHKRLE